MTARFFKILLPLIVIGFLAWHYFAPKPHTVNSAAHSGPIVAFGDSLTAGYGAEKGQSYPDALSRIINRPVINSGVSGETIEQASLRLERDVLAHHPSIVIVLLGGNNLLQQRSMDGSFTLLQQDVERIQAGGAMVVLLGLKGVFPLSDVPKRYQQISERTGAVFLPDILGGIYGDRARMSDQVHPNAAGYAVLAERVAKTLKPFL